MVGVFLDSKTTFDMIFYFKIYVYGIRGNIYDWFESYFKIVSNITPHQILSTLLMEYPGVHMLSIF